MKRVVVMALLLAALAAGLFATGHLPLASPIDRVAPPKSTVTAEPVAPAVTVVRAGRADFAERIVVTGTLVPREEILIAPEVEGLRVVEVLAEEGMTITKGQVLAKLETATLDAQLAQNAATMARAGAAIAQAESAIVQAEARLDEARNALERAKPLRQSGHLADSIFDQREAAAKTASAVLIAARDGLLVARAEQAQAEAQRRELMWRLSRTEIRSPVDGIISRRTARVGQLATTAGDAMFRIIAAGKIELDAEVPEDKLSRLAPGQPALVEVAGVGAVKGEVRFVSPEIDRNTRLGHARILLEPMSQPRIGSFARGSVLTSTAEGVAAPSSAVLFGADGAYVQVVDGDRIATRRVQVGLRVSDRVEVRSGLAEGDVIVAKSGTFLRDGDRIRPILAMPTQTSEVK